MREGKGKINAASRAKEGKGKGAARPPSEGKSPKNITAIKNHAPKNRGRAESQGRRRTLEVGLSERGGG